MNKTAAKITLISIYVILIVLFVIGLGELFFLIFDAPTKPDNLEFPEPDWAKRFAMLAAILLCFTACYFLLRLGKMITKSIARPE